MIGKFFAKKLITQNRKLYDKIARQFADTRTFLWDDLKPLADYVQNGERVLDVACGSGRLYQLFEKKQVRYTGVDYSKELIKIAKEEYPKAQFFVRDMKKLKFPEKSFDTIFCIAAFQHIPTEEFRMQTLLEMRKVLKPGGKIIFLNWNLFSTWAADKYKKFAFESQEFMIPWRGAGGEEIGKRYYHGFLPEELEHLFGEAGFSLEDQYYVKKGERSTKEKAENIISIATLPRGNEK